MFDEQLQPEFLEGSRDPLFCLSALPLTTHASPEPASRKAGGRHIVLFLPPFGEEINVCRRFYSLARARMVQQGLFIVQPDLFGTGDSAGEFKEATWQRWQEDLVTVVTHIIRRYSDGKSHLRLSLVAARAGSLMANDVIRIVEERDESVKLQNLVFVQPERRGIDIVNRLFRARIMAQQLAGDRSQKADDLWTQVTEGKNVHAGGHFLSATLCQALKVQNLNEMLETSAGKHRTWFEQVSKFKTIDVISKSASTWNVQPVGSSAFWQSYESEPEASLLDAVVSATAL